MVVVRSSFKRGFTKGRRGGVSLSFFESQWRGAFGELIHSKLSPKRTSRKGNQNQRKSSNAAKKTNPFGLTLPSQGVRRIFFSFCIVFCDFVFSMCDVLPINCKEICAARTKGKPTVIGGNG